MIASIDEGQKCIETEGFVVIKDLCPEQMRNNFLEVTKTKLEESLAALEGKEIGIGSAQGYKEIVQRSRGRWDVPIDLKEFNVDGKSLPWWPVVADVLGEDAEVVFQGVVSSEPSSPDQEWHIDSPHTDSEHGPANILNVLIALEDIPLEMGPTELAKGSHFHTNHFKNPKIVVDHLVYQHVGTNPSSLLTEENKDESPSWTTAMPAGAVLIFDDRTLHRGRGNHSNKFRHVAYFSYKRNDYDGNTYFETERSLSSPKWPMTFP